MLTNIDFLKLFYNNLVTWFLLNLTISHFYFIFIFGILKNNYFPLTWPQIYGSVIIIQLSSTFIQLSSTISITITIIYILPFTFVWVGFTPIELTQKYIKEQLSIDTSYLVLTFFKVKYYSYRQEILNY